MNFETYSTINKNSENFTRPDILQIIFYNAQSIINSHIRSEMWYSKKFIYSSVNYSEIHYRIPSCF